MDRELLVEIGVEELPASWLPGLTTQLRDRLKARLTEEGLTSKSPVEAFATPRRLTACQPELIDRQDDRDEDMMGPPVSAAFDAEGHPTNAGLGFARKLGVDFDALQRKQTPKGEYLSYVRHIRGRATVDVLPGVLGKVLRDLQFPKQMHWDAQLEDDKGELTFGRPIRWLLYLYGGRVVPFTISRLPVAASSSRVQEVATGAVTYGHRFLASSGRAGRAIKVRSFDEYRKKLTENFVILSSAERRDRILRDLESHARRIGGRVLIHQHAQAQALVEEVPDLVEFPAVVAGVFSPDFLTLPAEVLTTTLIHHQHFFPVITAAGALMPAFLAVTNTQTSNDKTIAANAERVVAARLRDARFFWDADRQAGLESRLPRLEGLLFHKVLGSYAAKTERVERLARRIATDVLGANEADANAAARAARLAKADLATDMVREFTELQGVMGGVYAREAGEPEQVWKAIYHQYLPIGVESSAAPTTDALGAAGVSWAAVALADKLDTIVGLFRAGERPTGTRDPFGLRRQAHGVLRILLDLKALVGSDAQPSLGELVQAAVETYGDSVPANPDGAVALDAFLRERLAYALQQRGAAPANVRAVMGARPTADLRPSNLELNLRELAAFSDGDSFRKLAEAFKRVRNIARELGDGADSGDLDRSALTEPAETALLAELDKREKAIGDAVGARRDYRAAYTEAAGFEPAVATFFKEVLVMAEDPRVRDARLRLMRRLERLILQLGDISEIVSTET
jgi:glycyl-tRNA synthetase beta chain